MSDCLPADERLPTRAGDEFLAGCARVAPVAVSVPLYGALLGALAAQTGLSPLEVGLMSALVFSGAAQFVAVELWTDPVAIGTVALATLLVGLRHTLMSATLAPALAGHPPWRAYGALFFMVDEAWAFAVRRAAEGRLSLAYYAGLCAPLYLGWLASTVAGALLGGVVSDPARYGFDVVFTAVFIVLIAGLWRGRGDLPPWAASAVAAVACYLFVPGTWYIFVGGVVGMLTAALTWKSDDDA